MPSRELPNLKLKGFWNLGEDAWKAENDTNLLKLSVLVQAGAIDTVAAEPGAPANGDVYVLTGGANANKIAIRDNDAWVYVLPLAGWWIYVRLKTKFYYFDGDSWEVYTGSGDLPPTSIEDAGKFIKVNDLGNGYELDDIEASALPIPTGEDAGKVVAVNAEGDGFVLVESTEADPHVVLADQAAYDALDPPDADTFYFIPEA